MKKFKGVSIAALYTIFLSACGSSYMASQVEYDDMYYSAADRNRESFQDVSFNTYSNFKEDSDPLRIDNESDLPDENYSAKTINPDYLDKYSTESTEESSEYGDSEYFSESYDSEDGKSTIVNNYYGYGYGMPYRYNYRYYDPFYYDPYWYSPYYSYYYRPGFRVTISYNYGWGGYRWNNWYLYDPYYGYSPSWVYSAMYCPSGGYYYGATYGYGYYSSYGYTNVIYYNNNYVNVNPDNINGNTRRIVKGPRPSRGAVSSLTDGTPSRNTVSNTNAPSRSRIANAGDSPTQSSYYRRTREAGVVSRNEIDRNYSSRTLPSSVNQKTTQSVRTSTNYVRPKTNRSSLGNIKSMQRSSQYQINNNTRQRSSVDFNRNRQTPQFNTSPSNSRNFQFNRSSPSRSSSPTRSNVSPSRSNVSPSRSNVSPSRSSSGSSGSRSGKNNSSSSRPARKN